MPIAVKKLSPNVGAEISGIDLSEELPPEAVNTIRDAWLQHGVIVFRDQDLDDHAQVRVAEIFGELKMRPFPKKARAESQSGTDDPYDGYTMLVSNIRKDGKPIGSLPDGAMHFHADMVYTEVPARATILYGVEVTENGGETLFASLTAAYDDLDEDTKALLRGKRALQGFLQGTTFREDNTPDVSFVHPMVQVIPETGRKALVVSRLLTFHVEDMDPAQSDALLERLFDHIERPENIYAHKWRPGDLVIWDNRTTVHGRNDFDPSERRLLRRYVTLGQKPVAA
ncbi:MAG: TauD/TfdA family dioxygenase [Alphaproteobacteria bacterium]|nr:TauD/TfdA family dioxygenase [Alphaproteobacteria bacterium]